jgi:methylated-DNA-[protein]-cysteine S-methyltransferase
MLKERVFEILKTVPKGKVTTYKELARALGNPQLARAVGNALNKNPFPDMVPCFKVIKSNGAVGGFTLCHKDKIRRLRTDGVEVIRNKVNLEKYFFKFPQVRKV